MAESSYPSYDSQPDLRWWRYDGQALVSSLITSVRAIRQRQTYRRELDLRNGRLYGNFASPLSLGIAGHTSGLGSARLSLNVIKNMCQAATAKVTKNRPKPMFLTSGGDYTLQKRAKLLNKFAEGQFYATDLYSVAPTIFTDATIYGTGILKIFEEESDIKIERVFPWEIVVDEEDGRNLKPRQMFQISLVDRLVLKELFKGHGPKIMSATWSQQDADTFSTWTNISNYFNNLVAVYEGWHLPSGKNAKDGRHIIAIDNDVLLDEPWERNFYPFAMLRWSQAPIGFWGIGLSEELTGIQLEINRLLRNIQQSHHLLGKSHWMVENSSKVLSTNLDNDIGTIIRYSGVNPPQVYTPTAVPPEIYQHLWQLYQRAYEIAGISQLSAQSQKPSGLDSGKALRIYSDIQTERFIVVAREYEKFFIDVSKQMIQLAREISAKDPDYAVKVHGKDSFERIKWDDINLEEDEYVLQAFPTNALAGEPAARMQQVQEMMEAGLISQEEGLRLLDFPDLESALGRRFASHELIESVLEKMIDKGEYMGPDPFIDLQDALTTAQQVHVKGTLNGVPEEHLELVRRYMSEVNDLMQAATAPAAPASPGLPPEMAPPMGPEGFPTPPPLEPLPPGGGGAGEVLPPVG